MYMYISINSFGDQGMEHSTLLKPWYTCTYVHVHAYKRWFLWIWVLLASSSSILGEWGKETLVSTLCTCLRITVYLFHWGYITTTTVRLSWVIHQKSQDRLCHVCSCSLQLVIDIGVSHHRQFSKMDVMHTCRWQVRQVLAIEIKPGKLKTGESVLQNAWKSYFIHEKNNSGHCNIHAHCTMYITQTLKAFIGSGWFSFPQPSNKRKREPEDKARLLPETATYMYQHSTLNIPYVFCSLACDGGVSRRQNIQILSLHCLFPIHLYF